MNSLKLLTLFALIGSGLACQTHVITKKAELSRDHTFICFEQVSTPYVGKGEVGGEHISFTKILAFANQQYQIEASSPQSGNLQLNVVGNAVTVEDLGALKKKVTVSDAFETLVEISLTAHPDSANYTLTVTRLP